MQLGKFKKAFQSQRLVSNQLLVGFKPKDKIKKGLKRKVK